MHLLLRRSLLSAAAIHAQPPQTAVLPAAPAASSSTVEQLNAEIERLKKLLAQHVIAMQKLQRALDDTHAQLEMGCRNVQALFFGSDYMRLIDENAHLKATVEKQQQRLKARNPSFVDTSESEWHPFL